MELESISLPAINRFASLYLEQKPPVTDFFHYHLSDEQAYKKRAVDLQGRTYKREALAACIEEYMEPFPYSKEVSASIEKLKDERSAVVIGGQQAGLLTGPLYTIYKIISIIQLAEKKEKELNIPVVPVFWIAGEDHDFQEVNHVYIESESAMKKAAYPERILEKKMVSDIEYDQKQMASWIHKVFTAFGETEHTNDLLRSVLKEAERAKTMTEFFARLIHSLFNKYGLLLIDAAYPKLRKLEQSFFKQLIEEAPDITEDVLKAQRELAGFDFQRTIDLADSAANLFVYEQGNRVLLDYDRETDAFLSKSAGIRYSRAELLDLLEEAPERFSNNVVTRPLMQEWLFPTLAFIAGPGEIAYWAELKYAFERMGMDMPPIAARLNVTLLERNIERDLQDLGIPLDSVLYKGVAAEKEEFWNSVKDDHFHEMIERVQQSLMTQYEEIEQYAHQFHKGAIPIVLKNRNFHLEQLQFLARKTDEIIGEKHAAVLRKYSRLQNALRPENAPQERMRNVYEYLNKYGTNLVSSLMDIDYPFNGQHHVVKL